MAVDFPDGAKDRFWKRVNKKGPLIPDMIECCWVWVGALDKDGYGVFGVSTLVKSARAHRVAWEFLHGDPGDLCVLHECDNPSCCNPEHLFLGTQADNMRDKMGKGRHRSGLKEHPERAAKGEGHGNAKLTEEQVREIRERYVPRKVTLHQLAKEFGVSFTTVHRALREGWRHIDVR